MFKLPTKRSTLARNSHLVSTAQRTLAAVTPIIQQQNFNSMQVSGYPIFVYNRMTGGKICSCSLMTPLTGAPAPYDNEGNASVEVLDRITRQAQFGIEEYNPEMMGSNKSNANTVIAVNSIEDGVVVEPQGEEDLTEAALLDQGSAGACPICQGTSFIGGYNFMQGLRKVLTHFDVKDYDNMFITKSTAPYEIVLQHNGWVTFEVLLPMLPSNSPPPRLIVWNGYRVMVGRTMPQATPAIGTPYLLGSDAPTGYGITTVKLEASSYIGADEEFTFTHIEIQIPQVSNPVYVDIPNLTQSYDASRNINYPPTSITLPPSVPLLKPWDVIADMRDRKSVV